MQMWYFKHSHAATVAAVDPTGTAVAAEVSFKTMCVGDTVMLPGAPPMRLKLMWVCGTTVDSA